MTRIVPYCQVDPGTFTNTRLEPYNCDAPGIANVTGTNHPTGQIVRSFLAGTTAWKSIGTTPSVDTYLSTDGGYFFGLLNEQAGYVSDVSQVIWGSVTLQAGGDTNTFFFTDFCRGDWNFHGTEPVAGIGGLRHGDGAGGLHYTGEMQNRHDDYFRRAVVEYCGKAGSRSLDDHHHGRGFRAVLQWLQGDGDAGGIIVGAESYGAERGGIRRSQRRCPRVCPAWSRSLCTGRRGTTRSTW